MIVLAMAQGISAQSLMQAGPGGMVRIFGSDLAVLEAAEPRKDLPCTVVPVKPVLGFDLRFHSGFDVSIPLKELAGLENLLTIIFRVSSATKPDEPHYFIQKIRVPAIEEEAKGEAFLQGSFDVGEGKYKVDWLMRDRAERVCAGFWDAEAVLPPKDKSMALNIQAQQIQASEAEQFREEPPVLRQAGDAPLNVKVLVNFAPQNSRAATLQPFDTSALVSILRAISRDPRVGKFTLVAFNMQGQQVLFRQEEADRIDFPAIGKSLDALKLGTVDLAKLAQKNSETEFLAELLTKELPTGKNKPDAVIFAGPKALLEQNVPVETLKQVGDVDFPVFYMNYNLNPQVTPWRDSIGQAVRHFRGVEYTISRPRDLWFAVSEMIGSIMKAKTARLTGNAPAQ
jgi:hypothetical protein